MVGFDTVFNMYCDRYPAKKNAEHKPNQVREKYAEIIEASGLDGRLLRFDYTNEKRTVDECMQDVNDKTAYVIPDESVEFVISILASHTSRDYKNIRRGDFDKVSGIELKKLVDGFVKMLFLLGYSIVTVREQQNAMQRRFNLNAHISLDKIKEECDALMKQSMSYLGISFDLNKDDQACFLEYIASLLTGVRSYISQVYSVYSDIRSDEIYEIANEEADNISADDIEKDYLESEAISSDEELQSLIEKRMEIIGRYDFVKNKRQEYAVVNEKINQRLRQHHMSIYGDYHETDDKMVVKHPMNVLYEAITYVGEGLGEEFERIELEKLAKSKEQIAFESAEAKELIKRIDEAFCKRREAQNHDSSINTKS